MLNLFRLNAIIGIYPVLEYLYNPLFTHLCEVELHYAASSRRGPYL